MHKRDFFINAMKSEAFRHKRWVIEAFSVTRNNKPWMMGDGKYLWAIHRDEQGKAYCLPHSELIDTSPTLKGQDYFDNAAPNEPVYSFKEQVVVGPGDIPNLKKTVTTTYGILLVNWLCLVYPFGDKIDFMEGEITIKRIEKIIEARLQDTPEPSEDGSIVRDSKWLYVDEYKKFNEAAFSLAGYTQLCVPSASAKTMTADPRIAIRRAELIAQYKDQLDDPVIQAKIGEELIAMDKAWLKGDSSEGFFIKDKSFEVVRKKLFLLQGKETGFDTDSPLIETSLSDGWSVDNLPAMGNSLREGSYSRGYMTALGGEATKFNYRIFQNTVVSEEDCGTKVGLPLIFTKPNAKAYVSSTVITSEGMVELTEENVESFAGRLVILRSPAYCKTDGINFCATCMGKRIASTPTAISTYAADVGSVFLNSFLKKMHGTSLKTARYSIADRIS